MSDSRESHETLSHPTTKSFVMKAEATKMSVTLEAIKAWVKEFEKTQSKYREYGANDTEPDAVFQALLDAAVHGKAPNVPRTGSGWELYASSMDCTEAAQALHDAALVVVQNIEATPIRDLEPVKEYLRSVCWRIY
jgi:hypothetical protein